MVPMKAGRQALLGTVLALLGGVCGYAVAAGRPVSRSAAGGAGGGFVVVQLKTVLERWPAWSRYKGEIDALGARIQGDLEEAHRKAEQDIAAIEGRLDVLTPGSAEWERERGRLQAVRRTQEDLVKRRREEFEAFGDRRRRVALDRVREASSVVARARGASGVLDREFTVFASPDADITDAVLEALPASLPDLSGE